MILIRTPQLAKPQTQNAKPEAPNPALRYTCTLDIKAGEDAMLQVSTPSGRIYPSVEPGLAQPWGFGFMGLWVWGILGV